MSLQDPLDIPGLRYIPNFLNVDEQEYCIREIDKLTWSDAPVKRLVQQYGFSYDYTTRTVSPTDPLPGFARAVADMLVDLVDLVDIVKPNQLIINNYEAGEGIFPHTDSNCFGDTVVSLSLGSPCCMGFGRVEDIRWLQLDPGSALVLTGEARYEWKHSIPCHYTIRRRVSMTFRTVNPVLFFRMRTRKQRKAKPNYAGLRQYTKARSTGTHVGVYNGKEAGFDTADGSHPWSTVCEEHGQICCHTTLRLARWHAPNPEGWCEVCMGNYDVD